MTLSGLNSPNHIQTLDKMVAAQLSSWCNFDEAEDTQKTPESQTAQAEDTQKATESTAGTRKDTEKAPESKAEEQAGDLPASGRLQRIFRETGRHNVCTDRPGTLKKQVVSFG